LERFREVTLMALSPEHLAEQATLPRVLSRDALECNVGDILGLRP